jgi:phospho-N-acetylmuramoyl-pentapeptide-transferase
MYLWLLHFPHMSFLKYVTIRFGIAISISFLFTVYIMPHGIRYLKNLKKVTKIREFMLKEHEEKSNTPIMGGLFIVISTLITSILVCDVFSFPVIISTLSMLLFGIIGFADDITKVKAGYKGLSAKSKFLLQMILSSSIILAIKFFGDGIYDSNIYAPLFKNASIDIGMLFFLFGAIVITGSSNAVNLTDGLDGLAIMPIVFTCFLLAFASYVVGNVNYSSYLHLKYIHGTEELCVFLGAIIGSSIGFLWFNAKPAQIFMGDTGSVSLGATLGVVSILIKHELILFIGGLLFVVEALSVILQVFSFKTFGKRIFLMSPLHHHFERKGWSEVQVVIRFWIIAFFFNLLAFCLIKLR